MKKITLFLIILSFGIGITIGYLGIPKAVSDTNDTPTCTDYEFINKQLGCISKPTIEKHEYTVFRNQLNNFITSKTDGKKVTKVSMYFRDLVSGPTMGIDDQEKFAPASLLKIPLLLTYLNAAETDPELLTKKLAFRGTTEILEQSQSQNSTLKPNTTYTVKELLEKITTVSDNLAYVLLVNSLKELFPGENRLQQTMIDLGLVNPRTPFEDTITVKSYASLFRHLYNSSYLSPEMSEYALSLLVKSEYDDGLKSGVAKDVLVAHKYGERFGNQENEEKQLHDCGIIYFPENPYLLCVMTRGSDFSELESVLGAVSEKIYQEVNSRRIE